MANRNNDTPGMWRRSSYPFLLAALCVTSFLEPTRCQHVRRKLQDMNTDIELSDAHFFREPKVVEQVSENAWYEGGSDDKNQGSILVEGTAQGIRGGMTIAPVPWFGVFQDRTLCGGSVIHGDILLTAAHCVDDNGFPVAVRVGTNDYFSGGTVANVIDGVLHPGWTWAEPSDPDLAILKLDHFFPDEDVVELNRDPNIPTSDQGYVYTFGYGLINDSTSSRSLIGAAIQYLDDCSSKSYTYEQFRHLCGDARYSATCGGDSGSPIMLSSDSKVQVGINSYSNGGCSTQTIDVYTRVSYFIDWIDEQVCKYSAQPPARCFGPVTEPPTAPTTSPTKAPTSTPTARPTVSGAPTDGPTMTPTGKPTLSPTTEETDPPTGTPTDTPTDAPSTANPTFIPTDDPTEPPKFPTDSPSKPTEEPSSMATPKPTPKPTKPPTVAPSKAPTAAPSKAPVAAPTEDPTAAPTKKPSVQPTAEPTIVPTKKPTNSPTSSPVSISATGTTGTGTAPVVASLPYIKVPPTRGASNPASSVNRYPTGMPPTYTASANKDNKDEDNKDDKDSHD